MTTEDDRELWSRAAGGGARAFGVLFDRHAKAVCNHCFRLTASWAEAEDHLQATFLLAWRKRDDVRLERESALPWLLAVATNVVRNEQRSLSRRLRNLRRVPPGVALEVTNGGYRLVSRSDILVGMTTVANFGGTSHHADLGGPVHWVDFGGPEDGPRIVLVHGLGGSHLNWVLLAPLLAKRARVTAVDLAGHGLTHPEGRQSTVQANTELLGRFLREVVEEPVVLVGNSMGGLISLFQTAHDPEFVRGLVLVDPALPMVLGTRPDPTMLATFFLYSVPGLGERFLARSRTASARAQVDRLLKLVCADPSGIPEELKLASEHLIGERAKVEGLDKAFLEAARSVVFANSKRGACYAAMAKVRVPVFLMSGDQDRLVNVAAARSVARRFPHWRYDEFANVGHVPQMEIPGVVSERVLDWMDAHHLITSAS